MKELFKKVINEFINKELPEVQHRDINIVLNTDNIVLIKGAKKAGKTCLLYFLIQRLRRIQSKDTIIFIDTEDERIYPFIPSYLDELVNVYYELYPENVTNTVYFFIDGGLNLKAWSSFAKKMMDQYKCRLVLTGNTKRSEDEAMAKGLKEKLLTYELFPLSFKEYLEIRKTGLNLSSSLELARIKHLFTSYISGSAFHEYIHLHKTFQKKAMQDYLDLVIFRELIEKRAVKNHQLVKYILKYLIENTGNLLSINNLYKEVKKAGLNIARNTPYDYIDNLEDSYLLFTVPFLTHNISLKNRNQRRIYFIDAGIVNSLSTRHSQLKIYENLVYTELRRQFEEVYYWKSKYEVDFCIRQKEQIDMISVIYSVDNKQLFKKKVAGLYEGMDFFNTKKAILINDEADQKIQKEDKEIRIVPLWKWLMEEDKFELIF
jgi:uncharacterized protein